MSSSLEVCDASTIERSEFCFLHAVYGANGAIIHYRPTPDSWSSIGSDNLFLLDSGAQYVDRTPGVTRIVHFGEPSPRHKNASQGFCMCVISYGLYILVRVKYIMISLYLSNNFFVKTCNLCFSIPCAIHKVCCYRAI